MRRHERRTLDSVSFFSLRYVRGREREEGRRGKKRERRGERGGGRREERRGKTGKRREVDMKLKRLLAARG